MSKIVGANGRAIEGPRAATPAARHHLQPEHVVGAVRAWLGAFNEARETRDMIAAERCQKALKDLAAILPLPPPNKEIGSMLIIVDTIVTLGSRIPLVYSASEKSAERLVVLMAGLEDDVRAMLAQVTGEAVPPRWQAPPAGSSVTSEDV